MTAETDQLKRLLRDSWQRHADDAESLARELEAAAAQVTTNTLAPFIHLSSHTIGEHLGDWTRVLRLGKRVLDGRTPAPDTAKAWGTLYVAAVLAGDSVQGAELELAYLSASGDDFGMALLDMRFMLAAALLASNRAREGTSLYRGALNLIGQVRPSSTLDRTIAVASNNFGWELYEMAMRTADDDVVMKLSAETSYTFWLRCGDWINHERALYLKAVVANATGDPSVGLENANAALAIVEANGDRPLDAARLHLARAVSLAATGDDSGRARAVSEADAIAAKLTDAKLIAEFAAERVRWSSHFRR
jgi:hypothetical protein